MKNVKISVVFLLDDLAEFLFNLSRNILSWVLVDSVLFKQLASFSKGQQKRLFKILKFLESIDIFNDLNLSLVLLFQSFENVLENLSDYFGDFKVRFFDFHLSIESHKLTKVSMGKRLFGSENMTDFVDLFDVSHDSHLFIELRRLGKRSLGSKVVKSENF